MNNDDTTKHETLTGLDTISELQRQITEITELQRQITENMENILKLNRLSGCNPYRLPADYPAPREILKVHFPKHADELLFSGGWGYDLKTATVVKTFDPEINPTGHFDGVSLERVFIQKRIWEELRYALPEGKRFYGSNMNKTGQQLVTHNGIPYDVVKVSVTAYPEKEWNELKADWEAHNAYKDDPEGKAKHEEWNKKCQISFEEEFWFDISDFF